MLNHIEGQKIAKKLSTQISKEGKLIRSLLEEYNACRITNDTDSAEFTISEVFDPSILENKLQSLGIWCSLASGERREIIDSYLILCRCQEEIAMLQEDAKNIVAYYENGKKVLHEEIQGQSSNVQSSYSKGATALQYNALTETSRLLHQSIHTAELIRNRLSQLPSSLDSNISLYTDSD